MKGSIYMNLQDLIQLIKVEFPQKAIDLHASISLVDETIKEIMEDINKKRSEAFSKRDFVKDSNYCIIAKEISVFEDKIDSILDAIDIDDEIKIQCENEEEDKKRQIPNYASCTVDENIEHTLYENFMHIRPCAIRISQTCEKVYAKTWQEVLLRTCDLLIDLDQNKFADFINQPEMNGKKKKYFSNDADEMRKPILVNGNIYIETNMSGNAIRDLIIKMIKKYGLKVDNYKVFFRADYSKLNE